MAVEAKANSRVCKCVWVSRLTGSIEFAVECVARLIEPGKLVPGEPRARGTEQVSGQLQRGLGMCCDRHAAPPRTSLQGPRG